MSTARTRVSLAGLLMAGLATCAVPAWAAVALGQLKVASGVGDPLLAELELPGLTQAESATLVVRTPGATAYDAAGLAWQPVYSALEFRLQRRADGTAFVRITSAVPVRLADIELLIEARAATGSVVRDYSVRLRPATAPPATGPQVALGQARVISRLGEPLRAEIDLPVLQSGAGATLSAALAHPSEWAMAGWPMVPAVDGLKVGLTQAADGTVALRLTGLKPVSTPELPVLLDVRWGNQRLIRDYVLAVPPPLAPPPAVQPPTIDPPASNPPASDPPPVTVQREKFKVRSGHSAAWISAHHRPAPATLEQTMAALVRLNPDAFVERQASRLREGVVLELPTVEDALGPALAAVPAAPTASSPAAGRAPETPAVRPAASGAAGQDRLKLADARPGPALLPSGQDGLSRMLTERAAQVARNQPLIDQLQATAGLLTNKASAPVAGASRPASASPPRPAGSPASRPAPSSPPRPAAGPASQVPAGPASRPAASPRPPAAPRTIASAAATPASRVASSPAVRVAPASASQAPAAPASRVASTPAARAASAQASRAASVAASQGPASMPASGARASRAASAASVPASRASATLTVHTPGR